MKIYFSITIFLSALLLFLVQPIISKLLLPSLGGTPAIWNTSMFFFQLILLAGYAYVHYSIAWLGLKKQAILHGVLLIGGIISLPLILNTPNDMIASNQPIMWLLITLTKTVGIPFFLLSCNAPLLQYWFSNSGHSESNNPYFLYSTSNAGSLLALFGYIIIVEPWLALSMQLDFWSVGLAICAVLLLVLAAKAVAAKHNTKITSDDESLPNNDDVASDNGINQDINYKITWKQKLYWLALAFVPSSLMLGVTTHISVDIASVPLTWLLPLAIYLYYSF